MPTPIPDSRHYWFPAKPSGRSWDWPAWQGWVFLISWCAVLMLVAPQLAGRGPTAVSLFAAVMAVVLLAVAYATSEPTRFW